MSDKRQPPLGNPPPVDPDKMEGDIPAAQETSLLNLRTFFMALGGLLALILIILGVAAALSTIFPNKIGSSQVSQVPPDPRLQVAPAQEYQALLATQTARLESSGWVDQGAQVAHIPIETAMQLLAGGAPAPGGQALPGGQAPADGAGLFTSLGCSACHTEADTPVAPTLVGLFGHTVQLQGGETVQADEAYLHESILQPHVKIVAGYQPIMPSFEGRVTDAQLQSLIDYIKSLGGGG